MERIMVFLGRLAVGLLALGLTACVSYQRAPIDTEALNAQWGLRNVAAPDVAEFARRLQTVSQDNIEFNPADGISLREAEIIALFFNGALRVARAELDIARAEAKYAHL